MPTDPYADDRDDARAELARQDRTMVCLSCGYEWNRYQRSNAWCPQCADTNILTEAERIERLADAEGD